MLFSSYIFIFAFLPTVLILYFLMSKLKQPLYQRVFLVLASFVFYAYFNIYYLFLMMGSIVINYVIAKMLTDHTSNRKLQVWLLAIGVVFNVLFLGYFKYYDFFIENINVVFGTSFLLRRILLPLGISFFTFQQLSFIISVYKKEEKISSLLDYALFVTFFPQLVAGPILLYKEMMPQWAEEKNRYFDIHNFLKGLYIFSIGLFKKLVIADTFALFVNNGYSLNDIGLIPAWIVVISYTAQIYFDFSGYSDMAVGLAKMFNLDIPNNFNSPYKSQSITEFWRRWHITLGRAMKEYVYIPLGGNRKGKYRTYMNLVITFLVSGLWHGASWTFVIWGSLHGLFMIVERIFYKPLDTIKPQLRLWITFFITNLLWVLFRAPDLKSAFTVYRSLFNLSNLGLDTIHRLTMDGIFNLPNLVSIAYIFFWIGCAVFLIFFTQNATSKMNKVQFDYRTLAYMILLIVVSIIHLSKISPFIYFNF